MRYAGLGVLAGLFAIGMAGLEPRFLIAALAAAAGLTGALVLLSAGILVPALIVALAVGATVTVSISFFQHYETPGHYVPNVGGAAGITLSFVFLTALVLIAAIAIDAARGLRPHGLRLHPPLLTAQLLFMATGLLSLVHAGDPLLIWLEEMRQVQLLVIFVAVGSLSRSECRLLIGGLAIGLGIQTLAALVQFVTGSSLGLGIFGDVGAFDEAIDFGSQSRATGFKGNPNILAYDFEILYPLCLALALSRAGTILRLVAGFGAASALAGVVLTLSRGGLLTVPLSTALMIGLVYRDRILRRATVVAGVTVFLGLSAAAVVAGPLVVERFTADDAGSFDQRAPLNAAAWSMIEQFPMLGAGLNNFGPMFPRFDTTGYARLFQNVNHVVHNLYLYVLGEVGFMGLTAFLAVFATAFLSAGRTLRFHPLGHPDGAIPIGCAMGLLAQLLHGLFDPGFRLSLGVSELIFIVLALVAASATAIDRQEREDHGGIDSISGKPFGGPDRGLRDDDRTRPGAPLHLDHGNLRPRPDPG